MSVFPKLTGQNPVKYLPHFTNSRFVLGVHSKLLAVAGLQGWFLEVETGSCPMPDSQLQLAPIHPLQDTDEPIRWCLCDKVPQRKPDRAPEREEEGTKRNEKQHRQHQGQRRSSRVEQLFLKELQLMESPRRRRYFLKDCSL